MATYNYPLDSNDVQTIFNWNYTYYMISPWNHGHVQHDFRAVQARPVRQAIYDIITGQGGLQLVGSVSAITSTNVWITNVTRQLSPAARWTMTLHNSRWLRWRSV